MNKNVRFLLSPYFGFSKTTWKIITAGFINATGLTLTLYISLYLDSLKYTVTEIGSAITLLGVGALIGGYLGGYLTDKLSALKICRASLLSSALLLIIFPLFSGLNSLRLISFLLGASSNLFRPAFILALTQDKEFETLEKIIALRRVAINLGMAFGAAIFSYLIMNGFNFLFWSIAAANLMAYYIIRNITDTQMVVKKIIQKPDDSIRYINFYAILFLMFVVLLIFNQSQLLYPLFLKNEANISVHLLSLIFTVNGALIATLQMPITSFFNKYNSNIACAMGSLLIGLGFYVLSFSHINHFLIILSCVLWTFGEIIFFPAVLALILRLSGSKKGKNVGLYQFTFSLALLAAPAFGTFIYAYQKNLFWHLSGAVGVIVCVFFLLNIRYANFPIFSLTTQKTES